jgi:hypothetical protein
MARTQFRMVGVLMKSKHEVSFRLDPVDPVEFVFDTVGIPIADLQSCVLDLIGFRKEHGCLYVRDDVTRTEARGAVSDVITASLLREPVVNFPKQSPLCVTVATSEEDHQY